MNLIGVIGVAGSGKTLVARHLVDRYGFERRRFAEPMKRMLKLGLGLTDEELDGDAKQRPLPAFGWCTPRHIMQTLGTDWGRRMIHSDIWVSVFRQEADRDLAAGKLLVVDDVRFHNEAAGIKALGGTLWRVYRPGLATMDHASERAQASIVEDVLITNATSVEDLVRSVDSLMR